MKKILGWSFCLVARGGERGGVAKWGDRGRGRSTRDRRDKSCDGDSTILGRVRLLREEYRRDLLC